VPLQRGRKIDIEDLPMSYPRHNFGDHGQSGGSD
jgi:hypothetical protein